MKKRMWLYFLAVAVVATVGVSTYATSEISEAPISNSKIIEPTITVLNNQAVDQEQEISQEADENTAHLNIVPTSFPSVQDEIIYKMLNSMDYFTTADVKFSALFPGFDVEQDYTIETNLNTGISHQTCSDNFVQTRSADTSEAYETYSDGELVRQYDNLARTVQVLSGVQERRTLNEEWPGLEDRYYIDENGDPHYRYRGNPTNADMAGECLLPQVSAFAYLMDKDLWEVVETLQYCGRECYSIEGTVNDRYSAQIGADTFMMYVDKATGILLKLEAYDEGKNVVSSMVVSEISIDAAEMRSGAFEYDMSKYEGYTELPSAG